MKYVHKSEDGFLYDPAVRESVRVLAADGDTLALEAAAGLRSATQAVDRMRGHGAGGRGVSAGAMDVLVRLATADGLNIGELARAGGVSSRNVTGLVDTLERDGLVTRVPDREDRRSVRVHLTDAGREWLDAFREPTRRAMSAIFHGFTREDLARFRHLCLRVVENQRRIEAHLRPTEDTP